MAKARTFTIRIVGDAKQAQKALQGVGASAKGLTGSLAPATLGLSKLFAATAGVVGFAAITRGIGNMVSAAYESQKVLKQTEAIIRATGGAAGMTAADVAGLADSLSKKVGIDDEAIQSSLNLLLTFKKVRNETGEGNKIFDRAAQAALDLGNVFGSTDSAALQLGKALSDPVRGLTALRRSGINFTQQQQDMVKALVASNDILSAQKLILDEVESQVGGTAAATATSADRFKVAFENVQESIGTLLLPAMEAMANYMLNTVIPFVERLVAAFKEGGLAGALSEAGGAFLDFTSDAGAASEIVSGLLGILAGAATAWLVYSAATTAATIATMGLSAAIATIPVIGQIAVIIGLIIAGFTYLILKSQAFRDTMKAVWNGIVDFIEFGINSFLYGIQTLANGVIKVVNVLIDTYNALPFTPNIGKLKEFNFQLDLNALKFGTAAKSADDYYASMMRIRSSSAYSPFGQMVADYKAAADAAKKAKEEDDDFKTSFSSAPKESAVDRYLKAMRAGADRAAEEFRKLRDEIASNITGLLDLGSAFDKTQGRPRAMVRAFVQQGKEILDYTKNLAQLQRNGLGDAALQQILGMDLISGAGVAQALVDGGDVAIRRVNRTFNQIAQAGMQFGTQFATAQNPAGAQYAAEQQITTNNVTQTFNVTVTNPDPNAVVKSLRTYQRQNGSIPIKVTG